MTTDTSSTIKIIDAQRKGLPIYSARKRLIKELNNRTNVILIGQTGCGKTTQVPQVSSISIATFIMSISVVSCDSITRICDVFCIIIFIIIIIIIIIIVMAGNDDDDF